MSVSSEPDLGPSLIPMHRDADGRPKVMFAEWEGRTSSGQKGADPIMVTRPETTAKPVQVNLPPPPQAAPTTAPTLPSRPDVGEVITTPGFAYGGPVTTADGFVDRPGGDEIHPVAFSDNGDGTVTLTSDAWLVVHPAGSKTPSYTLRHRAGDVVARSALG